MNRRFYPRKTKRFQRRDSQGFSLLEMLTVMAVITLLLGLSGGALYVLTSTGLSTSTRQFADFVNSCRSEAIARHTAVRVGIVETAGSDERRQYSAWSWNRKRRQFEQMSEWRELSADLSFSSGMPLFVQGSAYAAKDASSVRGDYVLSLGENRFKTTGIKGEPIEVTFFQFNPSGRVEAPGAEMRNLIVVIQPGGREDQANITNWSQINLDTLTGRYRVFRP